MTSKEMQLLSALVNGESIPDFVPVSRMEAYLKNCCLACGCDGLPAPISAADALLYKLAEQLAGGGTGDSTGSESGGGASGIYMAKITPAEAVNNLRVTHNLGTTDILFAALVAENSLGDITPNNSDVLASVWTKTDIPNNRGGVGNSWYAIYNSSNGCAGLNAPSSSGYWNKVVDENTFSFQARGGAAAKVVVGVTYTVIIMAASAFKETEG